MLLTLAVLLSSKLDGITLNWKQIHCLESQCYSHNVTVSNLPYFQSWRPCAQIHLSCHKIGFSFSQAVMVESSPSSQLVQYPLGSFNVLIDAFSGNITNFWKTQSLFDELPFPGH